WVDAGGSVPVVWLAEDPDADLTVAASYADFYSTTAEWALQGKPADESGSPVAPDSTGYFTGTARDGTKRTGFELGKTRAGIGVLNSAAAGRTPLFDSTSAGTVAASQQRSFFALSPVFAVAAAVSDPADAVFAAVPKDLALAENANGSTTAVAVGSPVVASDANGDKITYGLEGVRPAGWPGGLAAPKPPAGFVIDAGSGQISYTGTGVDREALPGGLVAMVVTATSVGASGTAATVRQPVSVTVTDVDEGDAGVALAGVAVAGRSTLKLDGVSGDPDGDPASAGLTLQWQVSPAKSGPWAAATGTGHSTGSYGVPAGDAGRWLRLRVSYTDGGGTAETVFSDPVEVGTLSLLSVLVEPKVVLGAGSKITDKASLAVSLDAKVLAGETVSVPLVFAGGALGTDFTLAVAGSPQGVTLTGATVKFTGPSAAAASATVELTVTSAAALDKKITVKPGQIAATGGSLTGTRLAGSASRGGLLVSPDPVPAAVTVSLARADSGAIVEHTHAGTPAGDRDAELAVTLDRALTAGEQVQVPLVVSGTGVTAGDIAWALKAGDGVNTGVRLGGSALAPTVTFSAGARAASLLLAASDDFVDEGDETVTVALGDLAGGGLSTSVDDVSASDDGDPNTVDNTVAVVVTDNDTAGVVVSVVDGLTYVAENGGTDTYTVRLASEPTHDVVVTVTSGDQTAAKVHAGSGSAGASATLTFGPGDWHAAQTVTVTGVDDSTARPGTVRNVDITHAAASDDDNYDGATGAPVAVRVGDASTAQVALTAPASVTESRSVQVTATLTAALTAPLTVPLTVVTGSSTAAAGDYRLGASITIPAGSRSATTTLAAVQDDADEPPETVMVRIGSLPARASRGSPYQTTVTIADDDPNTVTLARAGSGPVIENSGTAKLTVTLTRALAAGERIDIPLALSGEDITAADVTTAKTTGAANTGVAVAAASTLAPVVTFAGAGAKTAELTLSFADSTGEDDETLTVTLGDLAAKALQSNHGGVKASDDNDPKTDDNTFAVEIIDDDGAGLIVSPGAVRITEGSAADATGAAAYTVRLGTPPTGAVTVTATAGTNLQVASTGAAAATATLSFTTSNWYVPQTVTVTAAASVDDNTDNPGHARHNSTVTHTASGYGSTTTGPAAAVTIVDDEATTVSVTAAGKAREGDPSVSATLTVTLSRALVAGETAEIPITLDGAATRTPLSGPSRLRALSWTVAGTGATIGTDSRARRPGPYGNNLVVTLTGAGARTATVKLAATARDDRDTADETITIALPKTGLNHPDRATTLAGGLTAHSTQHTATTTITDKSTPRVQPGITLTPTSREVDEGATAAYTVVLDADPGSEVTVSIAAAGDVTVSPATLVFTPSGTRVWNKPVDVTVTAGHDTDSADDTATIVHTAAQTGTKKPYDGLSASLTVTVDDDDPDTHPDLVLLTPAEVFVTEGGPARRYGVRLAADPGASNTVSVTATVPREHRDAVR
ncbi:MAG: hypothetical protein OXG09_00685, partial [Chloroflexi bacterium]|nr:hypothetical protein [Chloroflexota bacterium]